MFLGEPRRLQHFEDGAPVHDSGPCRRRRGTPRDQGGSQRARRLYQGADEDTLGAGVYFRVSSIAATIRLKPVSRKTVTLRPVRNPASYRFAATFSSLSVVMYSSTSASCCVVMVVSKSS